MLSQKIKDRARELGFAKVGIVRADALTEEGAHLREWLGKGFHGQMQWMEREPDKRSDPRILMPGAKSVVVVLLNYFTSAGNERVQNSELGIGNSEFRDQTVELESNSSISTSQIPNSEFRIPNSPKISRYAWGDDYHDVVGDKLKELFAYIKELEPSAEGKVCVDTSAMMDKAWAVRAGLGWMGKHTNVITRELGSWVFIGEIITNLELEYDDQLESDRCGTCTACIDACPTDAIVEPYVVDSKRCISYATIELRDPELPREIADNLNGWLYGCDICQDVCPWNRFEQPTDEKSFLPREVNIEPDLDEILAMDQERFSERFRKSAIKRTKLSGLQRNARAVKGISDEGA